MSLQCVRGGKEMYREGELQQRPIAVLVLSDSELKKRRLKERGSILGTS